MVKYSDIKKLCLLGFISFFCSGCIYLAAGYVVSKIVKKTASKAPRLSDNEREELEVRNIEGTLDDIFEAVTIVFKKNDFFIEKSDYENKVIKASSHESLWQITAYTRKQDETKVHVRIVIEEEGHVVENKRVYNNLFNDIQEELENKL